MDKLSFIKEALDYDINYWKNAEKEKSDRFYRGAIAGLEALKTKIEITFDETERKGENENGQAFNKNI